MQVLKRIEVNQVVEKTFKKCKSAGYKKIHHRDGYAGLSKRQVLKCVTSNERLGKFYVSFTNKPKSRLTSVKIIQEQHQINWVDIKSLKVEYKGKCYRYIFFADGHIFAISLAYPLTRKKSSHVKKKLQWISKEYRQPDRLQSDNGGEFKRQVKNYWKNKKIKKWLTVVRTTRRPKNVSSFIETKYILWSDTTERNRIQLG